jgi:hypothetical protein
MLILKPFAVVVQSRYMSVTAATAVTNATANDANIHY